nr:unnamed protein product [Spirometra erinaceieuropaei]
MPKGPKAAPTYCKLCHKWEKPSPNSDHFSKSRKKAYIGYSDNEVDASCSGTTLSYENLSFDDENWLSQETLPTGEIISGEFLLAEV